MTPRSQNSQGARHQGVRIHIGHDTNELESIVDRTPRSQNPQWAEHQ